MNIESLKNFLTGPSTEAKPSDLEIALARIHADHTSAMVAIKLLTESVQSNAAGNLDMIVVHEERHKDITKTLRDLKKDVTTADSRYLAAFELALRPMTRAINDLMDKVNGLNAEVHGLKNEIYAEREAQARIQNTKLNAIAIRIDHLVKILAKDLIKHPEGVTLAPPKSGRGGRQPGAGRKPGSKPRPPEVRYADLSNKLQRCRSPKARAKYLATLVTLRRKLGMVPLSDKALERIAQ